MSPAQHGILVVSGLFLGMTVVFALACLAASAAQAAQRRRDVTLHREQVELARRAHVRVEVDRRRSAQCPRAGSAAQRPHLRRAS